jgi:predicted Fe-S protein YdhL (DUF1289 family)
LIRLCLYFLFFFLWDMVYSAEIMSWVTIFLEKKERRNIFQNIENLQKEEKGRDEKRRRNQSVYVDSDDKKIFSVLRI